MKQVNGEEIRKFDVVSDDLSKYPFDYLPEKTKELRKRSKAIRNGEKLTARDLTEVLLWKINRVLEIDDTLIDKLDNLAKDKNITDPCNDHCKKIINELTQSQGVGFPVASAILKFLHPDIFPIIDARAYRALFGKKISYSQYSVDIYCKYIRRVYEIKEETGIDLDKIDEHLYRFDKEYNGKI